jgi:hypothetical protein
MFKLFIKTSYIKINISTAMNFKERGITIGDLIIIIIIIISTTILLKVHNKDKDSTLNSNNQVVKFDKQISL